MLPTFGHFGVFEFEHGEHQLVYHLDDVLLTEEDLRPEMGHLGVF